MLRPIESQLFKKAVILGVGPNPKPDRHVPIFRTQRSPANANPHRIYLLFLPNPFELKTWVLRILSPELIASAGATLCMIGKPLKTIYEVGCKMRFQSSSNPISLVRPAW